MQNIIGETMLCTIPVGIIGAFYNQIKNKN